MRTCRFFSTTLPHMPLWVQGGCTPGWRGRIRHIAEPCRAVTNVWVEGSRGRARLDFTLGSPLTYSIYRCTYPPPPPYKEKRNPIIDLRADPPPAPTLHPPSTLTRTPSTQAPSRAPLARANLCHSHTPSHGTETPCGSKETGRVVAQGPASRARFPRRRFPEPGPLAG